MSGRIGCSWSDRWCEVAGAGLASEIRGHLQYEKDFSGSDTLSEGLKDPFSVAPYGRELLQVCRQYRVGHTGPDTSPLGREYPYHSQA